MKLSIVVPCFNEEEVIQTTCHKLESVSNNLVHEGDIDSYEIIFVDDGSKDNTPQILGELAANNRRVKVIIFNSNFGQQSAMLAGILNSTGDAVMTMDADLQDPPESLKDFVIQFKKGCDVVTGIRSNRDVDPFLKRTFAENFYRIAKFLGVPSEFNASDFRLISKRVRLNLAEYPEGNLYLRGLIGSMKFKTGVVYYKREARHAGVTKYPFMKSMELALNGITSHSIKPLRIIGFVGIILFIISILLILWVFYLKIFAGIPVLGWASTISIFVFFQGLNFIFLSVIGEYLGKTYLETKARPRYVIDSKINFDKE